MSAENATFVMDFLRRNNYPASQPAPADAPGHVESKASGLDFRLECYKDSVVFRTIILDAGDPDLLGDFINRMNRELRFVKLYLAKDNLLEVEMDHWMTENHEASMARALPVWTLTLGVLQKLLKVHHREMEKLTTELVAR